MRGEPVVTGSQASLQGPSCGEIRYVPYVSLGSLTLCSLYPQEDFRDKVDEYIKRYAR